MVGAISAYRRRTGCLGGTAHSLCHTGHFHVFAWQSVHIRRFPGPSFLSKNSEGARCCHSRCRTSITSYADSAFWYSSTRTLSTIIFNIFTITLEDEAVIRDEAFAKAQASKHAPLMNGDDHETEDNESLQDALEARERREEEESRDAEAKERQSIHERRQSLHKRTSSRASQPKGLRRPSMQAVLSDSSSSWKTDRWRKAAPSAVAHAGSKLRHMTERKQDGHSTTTTPQQFSEGLISSVKAALLVTSYTMAYGR
ncbi:hypothetical protein MRB53_041126 [Persea americana]|nr:hypothetical protein MRB53_041126 [Persea americana]